VQLDFEPYFGGLKLNFEKIWSKKTKFMRESEIRALLKWISQGNIISFGGGMPDPKNIPKKELAEITYNLLLNRGEKILQYSGTKGTLELREELLKFMGKHGIKFESPENIIITTGSQQGLDLLGRIFIDPGDTVIVEIPTYLAAINAFQMYECKFIGVPVDDEGMRTDILEEKVKEAEGKGERIKFIYTIPTCQNPSGVSMSIDRRKHLLEIASKYDLLVVEDDPYSYFLYEPVEFKYLKSMDREGRVLFMSTFSKILAPGLRVGWLAGDREAIEKFCLAKQSMDLCTSQLNQFIASEALRTGLIERQLPKIREIYREKRNTMLKSLETYMPEGCRWARPIGGMFIFVWAPENVDTKKMLKRCLEKYRVAYVPGRSFHVDGSGGNAMRLNFTYPSKEEIVEGVKRLSKAIREEIESS